MAQTIITINQREVLKDIDEAHTVSQVVQDILGQKEHAEHILSQVAIDGRALTIDEEDAIMAQKLTNFQNINFTLKTNIELAFDALDSCNLYVDNLVGQITRLTEAYQKCNNDQANILFSEVIEVADLFIQLLARIQRTLRAHLGEQWHKPATIKHLELHLLSILKALVPAKEKNDIIMLCDLLEYELIDNLKQWKIKALPELRALRPLCESIIRNN